MRAPRLGWNFPRTLIRPRFAEPPSPTSGRRESPPVPQRKAVPHVHACAKNLPAVGRYSSVGGLSGLDLPREGKRAGGKIVIAHGHEVDPYCSGEAEAAGKGEARITRQRRQRVAINAQTDALEYEARRGASRPRPMRPGAMSTACWRPRADAARDANSAKPTAPAFRPSRCNRRWSRGSTPRERRRR